MDLSFIAGVGVGLSVGLAIALRLMAARDPVPPRDAREGFAPKLPRSFTGSRQREEELTR